MKYIVILGDGMADYPLEQFDNKTPLQIAWKPNIDLLAKHGEVGMVKTVPDDMLPGSDVANLAVMGYDPKLYYTGRSPLEAISMGIELSETDVAFRCNLVTLSEYEPYEDKIMIDYSSDEISSAEAKELINAVNEHFSSNEINYYPGISYRHCMVWKNGPIGLNLIPPHDILEKKIKDYLPKNTKFDAAVREMGDTNLYGTFVDEACVDEACDNILRHMMKSSYNFLKNHPINLARVKKGLKPANSIWLWGEGKKPAIPGFKKLFNLDGSVISAVDLIKGIAICAGLKSVNVDGATGNIHTNFKGKAEAALKEIEEGQSFVYVHIEAPDECGHRHETDNKIKSIELIDELVVGPIIKGLEKYDDYKILVMPDHPTPLSIRTHTSDPVPYIIYQKSKVKRNNLIGYDEFEAKKTGVDVNDGHTLMNHFIKD